MPILLACLLYLGVHATVFADVLNFPPGAAQGSNFLVESFRGLPGYFEPNLGQADDDVQFLARGFGLSIYLAPALAVFVLNSTRGRPAPTSPGGLATKIPQEDSMPEIRAVRMRFP